jgi:hypothetical protein
MTKAARIFSVVVRMVLGAILIVSGWSHLQNELMFYADVRRYHILGPLGSLLVSQLFPWVQICIGCCFFTDILSKGSSVLSCVLFLLFTLGQASVLFSGRTVDCGCFGVLHSETIGITTIAISISLLCTAVFNAYLSFAVVDQNQL